MTLSASDRSRSPRQLGPISAGARSYALASATLACCALSGSPSGTGQRAALQQWTAAEVAQAAQISCSIVDSVRQSSPEGDRLGAGCPDPTEFIRGDGLGTARNLPPIISRTPLPTDWDLKELLAFACGYACARAPATAHLLAWSVIEDDRPLRNHNALVLVDTGAENTGRRWIVVQMSRHAINRWWNINSRGMPIQHFDERPDNAAIDKLLARNEWFWHDERYNNGERWVDGFRVRAGNVLDGIWHQTLGRRPARLFPPEVEFPGM